MKANYNNFQVIIMKANCNISHYMRYLIQFTINTDPCCGHHREVQRSSPVTYLTSNPDGVSQTKEACMSNPRNPCHSIGDGSCTIDFPNNRHFPSLMRSQINITCQCDKERAGFRWSNQFSMCVGMYMYVRMNVCMYACMYVYKYVCIIACMYVRMYI